ncbi:MAG: hypothetical protein HGA96_01350 [Desulfobulbaceae bacterium]|nr:hypothetical protein [Desulfobulbaceae bacterium]
MKLGRLIPIVWLLFLTACGYHHPAVRPVASGAIAIHTTTWENRTNEIALEGVLLQKTADWLQQSRLFRIEADPNLADYLLSGTIEAVNFPVAAFNSSDRATILKAWVKVTYRVQEQATGKVLWEISDMVRERNFLAGTDAVRNRTNREEALTVIADELAEQIYLKLITSLSKKPPEAAK